MYERYNEVQATVLTLTRLSYSPLQFIAETHHLHGLNGYLLHSRLKHIFAKFAH
jgi:hypothetical protein